MTIDINKLDVNRKHDVTREELRATSLFVDNSDDEIDETIRSAKMYAEIALQLYNKQNLLQEKAQE